MVDLPELEPEPEIQAPYTPTEIPADSVSTFSKDEEDAFVSSVLGPEAALDASKLNRETEITAKWEDKPVNPQNKPVHPSVTEQYFTEGGKEVKAVHDDIGTLWHVHFIPGGQVPKELSGGYTSEPEARHAIKQYLAKRV